MEQTLAPSAPMVVRSPMSRAWDTRGTIVVSAVGIIIAVIFAAVAASWTVSRDIGDVRQKLGESISQSEFRLSGRLDHLGQRVAAIEGHINALRGDSSRLSQSQVELEQKIAQLPTDKEKATAVAADIERKLDLARVAALEPRILPLLGPTTRTIVGTVLSVVPGERIIAIEDQTGRSRAFLLSETTTAKGFCGGVEETLRVTDLRKGTAVVVAYDSAPGGRHAARLVAKSSCA